ncbi:luciferase family oxidoreductase, group 1 [Georgenia satyanarayanai]|uniref:Luciferase family oxidoreductase, group 1 n=1 Tax=Georgenia satyanarayanai TaxID=860221 RepID=A0A2Y8ZX21_9MICO|nr:LLM class flavin-dependent oxidoreductase [Georgenia satyanarayanai]PYG02059.1 luciferase family oxidoreductase group 1 [Georgenia satyanarayanai]SSA36870.1 luciferase family oxidoreductase, group 1 [Georgenia satyanarayanai]
MPLPLSILDLATVGRSQTVAESLDGTVALAQKAEETGYTRVWYAEHHNMAAIASSATSVLIAHVAAHTSTIRLGSGGVMLPNHSPLTIAEQYGTLETLHPGRIDLGLGRAPGTDQNTMRALRRDASSADSFPEDVLELQGYLRGQSRIPGVDAYPGKGTDVPLYILGSSLFGAGLAATLGLPYAFASHFAPAALHEAIALYRREFEPSAQLDKPHVIAAYNVLAADEQADAERQQQEVMRGRVALLLRPGTEYTDEQADALLASPQGRHLHQMMTYSAVGTPDVVREKVTEFGEQTGADEIIVAHQGPTVEERLRSAELLAEAYLT